ncbi:hypothetical protein CcI6DRAFT_02885 [Frankia sp. CcI6]|nr:MULTISPECIES: hypothetical protein [unclassified Frankia]ETA01705.1 hypothetical protein CcI6DRAFT_02885 [Frankia sp. CcI6]KFB03853.1 hypothetical protein ALLO2DRAFT_03369 [Frankia sp. Allo2]OAA29097.1 hypothetical protein AAY23_101730 [Frankia casuarinae]
MSDTTTLHIPIDRTVREGLEARAKRLGFDSLQAYFRVWAKAEAEGRVLSFGDEWGEPSPAAAARLHRLAAEALAQNDAGELPGFTSAQDFLTYLDRAEGD